MLLFWKTDLTTIIKTEIFNILPKGKLLSSESNLIFIKSFLYLIGLSPFIDSIWFLISFLFLFVEAKTKYLYPSFSSIMYPSTSLKIRQRIFTINTFTINTFHCDILYVIDNSISTFKLYFVYSQQICINIFYINHTTEKIILTI